MSVRPIPTLESLVLQELGEHLEAADYLAAEYARAYCRSMRTGRRVTPKPVGLHPDLAKLVRDLVLDAAVVERRAA